MFFLNRFIDEKQWQDFFNKCFNDATANKKEQFPHGSPNGSPNQRTTAVRMTVGTAALFLMKISGLIFLPFEIFCSSGSCPTATAERAEGLFRK